jgi:TIR domain
LVARRAAELQDCLRDYGVSAFVAHNDVEPTEEWQDEIENALATCDAMIALLREGFHASKWTDQEVGYAMGRKVLIITVRLGQDPYGFIGRYQAISGSAKPKSVLAGQIFAILNKNSRTKEHGAYGLVSSFVTSDSFAWARARTSLLAKAEYWDNILTNRCLAALEENSQIKDAFGVRN